MCLVLRLTYVSIEGPNIDWYIYHAISTIYAFWNASLVRYINEGVLYLTQYGPYYRNERETLNKTKFLLDKCFTLSFISTFNYIWRIFYIFLLDFSSVKNWHNIHYYLHIYLWSALCNTLTGCLDSRCRSRLLEKRVGQQYQARIV